jgi:hypothetical protein
MKRQIRRNVFETNSSSVHSISIASKDDFDKWVNGELLYDSWSGEFATEESIKNRDDCEDFVSFKEFGSGYETFTKRHTTTKSGDEIVAFGYYGGE